MAVPQPFPYQGSKRKLAPAILAYLPATMDRLVEPFAGSAALALLALSQKRVQRVLLNDLNEPLMRLWGAILHTPEKLAQDYAHLWTTQLPDTKAFYGQVRQAFNQQHCPEQLLYLLARCVKASVRYNTQGEFNQSADHRRKGMQPDTMQKHILTASALLHQRTMLQASDYHAILQQVTPTDIVYLDPPYQGVSQKRDPRYLQGLDFNSFITALDDLNRRNIPYLLSYDGKTGAKTYGIALPESLGLRKVELQAGRSSQATLLGRHEETVEALYISPALYERQSLAKA